MTKTYNELNQQVNEGMSIFSLVNRKVRTLFSMMNANTKRLSALKKNAERISLIDEQIKILAAIIIQSQDTRKKALNEIVDIEDRKNNSVLKEMESGNA